MLEEKHYNWLKIEKSILEASDEKNYYASLNINNNPVFSTIMPPPNVTGVLHMGHALITTIEDTLTRYYRMRGFDVLWQPGVDHAGIATQVIVEKQLAQKGINTRNLDRESFLKEAYKWKNYSADNIISQIKQLGSSCDFSYLAFTMDEHSIQGVNKAFVTLYNDGLIYQANRLVNWDCQLQTAISDLEVEQKEVPSKLYYLKYYLVNSNSYIPVATTRPETIFGDVAIAVNPEDQRYKAVIGQEVIVPLCNRSIKIIADYYPNMEKGSGAVKITPAHDFNDFEVGERHNLDKINILNKDGTLNSNVIKEYQGLSVKEARNNIIEELKENNLLEKEEDHIATIPYGDRSHSVIEPFLTTQWFLDVTKMAPQAIKVVKNNEVQFVPKGWENLYFDWMYKIKPWCISRQLWWGIRIPVWYCEQGKQFCAQTEEEALTLAKNYYGKEVHLTQDTDVLDTWFSSSLWPFLTLGWPDTNNPKYIKYFPTSTLVTGFDIIFFWVARMIMMSLYFTQKVPFKEIYITALIRDENGQKMSKSRGNVINPLELMEKYGTDALRFTLLHYSGHGRDIKMSEKTVEGFRNFVTKIWNSFKFCDMNGFVYNTSFLPQQVELSINKWILYKLKNVQISLDTLYTSYKFNEITHILYNFIWREFCDWYLELTKPILYNQEGSPKQQREVQNTLGYVFDGILKLIHPLMPFISQYLFNQLHKNKANLALEKITDYHFSFNNNDITAIDDLVDFITKIRNIRSNFNVPLNAQIDVHLYSEKYSDLPKFITDNQDIINKLGKINSIQFTNNSNLLTYAQDIIGDYTIIIQLNDIIDTTKEIERLTKTIKKLDSDLEKLNKKLSNPEFLQKAKTEAIEKAQKEYTECMLQKEKLESILIKLNAM